MPSVCAWDTSFLVVFISPTRTQTEERAPVKGSEFTTKASTLQKGFRSIRALGKTKVW